MNWIKYIWDGEWIFNDKNTSQNPLVKNENRNEKYKKRMYSKYQSFRIIKMQHPKLGVFYAFQVKPVWDFRGLSWYDWHWGDEDSCNQELERQIQRDIESEDYVSPKRIS